MLTFENCLLGSSVVDTGAGSILEVIGGSFRNRVEVENLVF